MNSLDATRVSEHVGRVLFRRFVEGLVIAAVLAGFVVIDAPEARAAAPCTPVLSTSFRDDLARRYPGVQFTAAVYDTATGCWSHLNPGLRLTTASVIKAQIMGVVLLRAQREGRSLTAWERSQIGPMIHTSFNPETSNLIRYLGGWPAMEASDVAFGATSTTYASGGHTASTAVDRTRAALRLLHGGGELGIAGRDEAWEYMSTVHPLQRWGISAGVPEGWSVAQKNGFYPLDNQYWRVGSSGFVRRDDADQGYGITVMTYGGLDQATNIRLVEEISRRAAGSLTVGPAAPRPVDRARCIRVTTADTWTGAAARLGLPASRAAEVRDAAGGDPSPLNGQRACSPSIPSEPQSSRSTVTARYRPAATDLACDGRDDLLWYAPGDGADSLWRGRTNRRFTAQPLQVRGAYIPVTGDFDGDDCGDVLWYGPGTRTDILWSGRTSTATGVVRLDGAGYLPRSGDFDGDGHDDILWYTPGAGKDYVWFGGSRGRFQGVEVGVGGTYEPVVGDFDGDGADDVFWYGVGSAPDAFWRGVPGHRRFLPQAGAAVSGRYRPVTSDLDGDGADELLWYAPGTAPELRWDGLPASRYQVALRVDGDYLPMSGDFDGDGKGDIAWYGPGGKAESMWWGGTPRVVPGSLTR